MTRAPKGDGYLPEQKIHVNIKKHHHKDFRRISVLLTKEISAINCSIFGWFYPL
jgi:hypothetical protein